MAGLVPLLWAEGTGADVMKRIAAPMVGGVVTSGIMELMVYPVLFFLWRGRRLDHTLVASSETPVHEDEPLLNPPRMEATPKEKQL
jgi:Cu(I)/Ag(I) efflux system membrane protein CusA/SilA